MNYIRNNVYPYTVNNLKADFPNVGFPPNPLSHESIRTDYGISEVVETAIPTQAGFRAVEGTPTESGGVYSRSWSLVQKTKEELLPSDIAETTPEDRTGFSAVEGTPVLDGTTWIQTWDYVEVDYLENRQAAYGEPGKQIEYLVENGVDAFITRQEAIKVQYPKPAE